MLKVVGFICCLNLVQNYIVGSKHANSKCLYFANALKMDTYFVFYTENPKNMASTGCQNCKITAVKIY